MATFIVTNAADSGAGSLRDAVAQANASLGADTITFDQAVFNGEAADRIRLTSGQLLVTESLTIDGGANGVLITGDANGDDVTTAGITDLAASRAAGALDDNSRILDAGFGVALTLSHLTLTGGYVGDLFEGGGAVRTDTLTITDSTLAGNGTGGTTAPGGAVFAAGNAAFVNVTFAGNATAGDFGLGGAAYAGGNMTLTNGTVTNNAATSGLTQGGGLAALGTLTLTNSIVLGNASGAAGTARDEVSSNTPLVLSGGNILGKGAGAADVFSGATDIGDTSAAAVFAATTAGPGGSVAGVLADHGGPVETVALRAGVNPAIDGGIGGMVAADARGVAAVEVPTLGATGSGAAVRDLGAFEVATPAETQSLVVTTAADVVDPFDGLTSLREAVAYANALGGMDTITFDQAVFNGEAADIIRLTGGTIGIGDNLKIDGGPNGVLITGDRNGDDVTYAGGVTDVAASLVGEDRLDDNTRVFDAVGTELVVLQRLTITGGRTTAANEFGGGVRGGFELQVTDGTIAGNSTTGYFARGGGVSASLLRLTNATLVGNTTSGDAAAGGGAYAGRLYAASSTVTGNTTSGGNVLQDTLPFNPFFMGYTYTASAEGGGLFGRDAFVTNSIVAGNATLGAGVGRDNIGFYRSADLKGFMLDRNNFGSVWDTSGINDATGSPNLLGFGGDVRLTPPVKSGPARLDETVIPLFSPLQAPTSIFDETTTLPNGTIAGVLADNGGPVRTVALLESSANPALDRSDLGPESTDALGSVAADVFGVGVEATTVRDFGAFEAVPPVTDPLLVTTASDIYDGFDGLTSLREAVIYANLHAGDDTITFDPTIFDGSASAIIRLTLGAMKIVQADGTTLTIDGGVAGVTITGDRLGNDVTDGDGITDVLASREGVSRLSDNSRILEFDNSRGNDVGPAKQNIVLANLTLTGGYATTRVAGTFGDNDAAGGAAAVGRLTLLDSLVKGNAATNGRGGAIASTDLTVLRSTITDNHLLGPFGFAGGGIAAANMFITDSVVSDNTAYGRGGGIDARNSLLITNSTVTGNIASSFGGGIYASDVTIESSTITGNTSGGIGGGLFLVDPSTISNSIILGNETTGDGVASENIGRHTAPAPTLTGNNIIGNDSGTGDIYTGATLTGTTTAAEVFADTLVLAGGTVAGVAADNGGPTETVALKLSATNPALGGADPATATATDQRGITRDATPELGAVEVVNDTPVATPDSLGTGRDMEIFVFITGNDTDTVGGLDDTSVRLLGADPGSDGRTLTVAGVGTWAIDPTFGALTFTPAPGFSGIATAQYTVADILGVVSAPAEIRVDVAPGARGTATAGNDRLLGSLFGDSMDGLGGDDSLLGRDGFDILKGGDGNDSIDAGRDFDSVEGGAGDDVILLRGGIQSRDDILAGGDGFDTVRVAPGVVAVTLTRTDWTGVEAFDGSGAKVLGTVVGDALDFSGFASVTGIAMLNGRAGDDTITGSAGADSILGNTGADWLTGGAGNDTMAGGQGEDRFIFGPGFGQDRILYFDANPAGGQDLLVLQGFGPAPAVTIAVEGADTRVTIGADSVLLLGVTGIGARVVTMDDILIL